MREHHAFRRARRARRVDEHGKIVGQKRSFVRLRKLRLRRPNRRAARFEGSETVAAVRRRIGRRAESAAPDSTHPRAVASESTKSSRAPECCENVGDVIERLRRIDRHDDAAGKERCEIADDPVDAVMRDQCDAIACHKTGVANGAGDDLRRGEQCVARGRRPSRRRRARPERRRAAARARAELSCGSVSFAGSAVGCTGFSQCASPAPGSPVGANLRLAQIRARALETRLRHSCDVEQLVERCEASFALAQLDDALRDRAADRRERRQARPRSARLTSTLALGGVRDVPPAAPWDRVRAKRLRRRPGRRSRHRRPRAAPD